MVLVQGPSDRPASGGGFSDIFGADIVRKAAAAATPQPAPRTPGGVPYQEKVELRWNDTVGKYEVWKDGVFDGWQTPSGGTGGGSAAVDHFGDVSGNQAAVIGEDARQFDATNALDQKKFEADEAERRRQAAIDERNLALSQGNLDLARSKQADANHWAGVSAEIERERNAITAQGNQLQHAAAMAGVEQAREDSNKRFQVGMAGAVNDQQRNQVEAQWNAEQAAIAKMEDETKRILGAQQNQVAQFGQETDRAARMGTLALDNNKFIAEQARSPRDLPGLFMMQRGIAPDWQTILAGGTPGTGASLIPADVMRAYVPTTAAPTFNGTPVNQSAAGVGAASAAGIAAAGAGNQFINANGFTSNPAPQQQVQPAYAPPVAPIQQPQQPPVTFSGWQPAPAQALSFKYGVPAVAADYRAAGGPTTAEHVVAGDAPAADPSAGGALPEGIWNPTRAPLFIQPNPETARMMALYGARRFAYGTDNSQAYADAGMGGAWIPDSENSYAASQPHEMPNALKQLAAYGYPISPALYASHTGSFAPTLNMSNAYRERGGGTLFGLQTLNNMSPSEQEAQRGISEGVIGMPWNDLVDYIARGTAGLRTAQQARAA